MVTINVRLDVPARTGTGPASGVLIWTPTRRRVAAGAVILPAPFQVYVSAGAATVEAAASGPGWAWRVDEVFAGVPQRTAYLAVPNVAGPLAYADLVAVDPATLDPAAEPVAAWWARADSTEATALAAKATADRVAADAAAGVFNGATGPVGPPGAGMKNMAMVSGAYAVLNPGPVTTVQFSDGVPYAAPLFLPEALPISEVLVNVPMPVAGTEAEVGYYTRVGNTFTLRASFGKFFSDTPGLRTFLGTWTLPAGEIWLAWLGWWGSPGFQCSDSIPAVPGPMLFLPVGQSTTANRRIVGGPLSQIALPATFEGRAMIDAAPVRFGVKVVV